MVRKLIRKKQFRKLLDQLHGAKKLREQNNPFFVIDTVNMLTDVHLGLKNNNFPKVLVGSHGLIVEKLLRQILLIQYGIICSAVMQSIGNGKPLSIPLPSALRKYFTDN